MKKILITGQNSYIGGMFIKWVEQWPDDYQVDEISVHGKDWKQKDFSTYDTVFHVAGIVHTKENKDNIDLFYKVNRDLTFEIAKKAKNDGVKQFIFMSTMNVYGVTSGVITEDTICKPKTSYGKSKLEAEKLIEGLQDNKFNIATIRPPMVYGPNTVGNYVRLSKLAKITPVFPNIKNKRSMIYIDNLSEFIRLIIDEKDLGIFHPQNENYVRTSYMVQLISEIHKETMFQTKLFNPIIRFMSNINVVNKVFGDLIYSKSLSQYSKNYNYYNFYESIIETEMEPVIDDE